MKIFEVSLRVKKQDAVLHFSLFIVHIFIVIINVVIVCSLIFTSAQNRPCGARALACRPGVRGFGSRWARLMGKGEARLMEQVGTAYGTGGRGYGTGGRG